MSNYPPGVTGNEWPIAGPAYDAMEERTCGMEDVTLRLVTEEWIDRMKEHVQALRDGDLPAWQIAQRIERALAMIEVVTVPVCPFDDEVEVWSGEFGDLHWECPVCRSERTEDAREPEEPEYDRADDHE